MAEHRPVTLWMAMRSFCRIFHAFRDAESTLRIGPNDNLAHILINGLLDRERNGVGLPGMQLVGEILYTESNRLGVAQPYFAPTILDGGVTKFTTGEIAELVIAGLRATNAQR